MSKNRVKALFRRIVWADAIEQSRIFLERSNELNKTPIPEESLLRFKETIDNRKMKKRKHPIYNIFRDKEQE